MNNTSLSNYTLETTAIIPNITTNTIILITAVVSNSSLLKTNNNI